MTHALVIRRSCKPTPCHWISESIESESNAVIQATKMTPTLGLRRGKNTRTIGYLATLLPARFSHFCHRFSPNQATGTLDPWRGAPPLSGDVFGFSRGPFLMILQGFWFSHNNRSSHFCKECGFLQYPNFSRGGVVSLQVVSSPPQPPSCRWQE